MKNKKVIIGLFLVNAALFFGLGALSDVMVVNVTEELLRRAGMDRNYEQWLSQYPETQIGAAYFRGRAEAWEGARELLLRANDTGSIAPNVQP